jgi:hypothetical protein
MYFPLSLSLLLPACAFAALNGHCVDKDHLGAGSWPADGICIHTKTCTDHGGVYASGWCPDDPADVKCCYVNTCDPDHGDGYSYCEWTDHKCPTAGKSGVFKSGELIGTLGKKECVLMGLGLCPGGKDYKCCVFGP